MRRAYKFRAYPTRPQEGRATRLLADHCDLCNAALEERREAWRLRQATITYGTQFRFLLAKRKRLAARDLGEPRLAPASAAASAGDDVPARARTP